ncbi:MAG: type I-C CRISPR-associated protein Cas8c/Csd1 [Verrucomicrobia bacterium]|nr:type I-C CRISPR-associated protein Cas8c/Csd1 [Verrucomicrobiota bacterium]
MILQALKEYYDRKAADPESGIAPEGFEKKDIPFIVVIGNDGKFVCLEDMREGDGQRARGKTWLLPRSIKRSGSRSHETTFLLWDHVGYLLGHPAGDSARDRERAQNQHQAWLKRLEGLPSGLKRDEGVSAVMKFYAAGGVASVKASPNWPDCIKLPNCNSTFRLSGESLPIPCRPAVQAYVREQVLQETLPPDAQSKDVFARCLVTGEVGPIAPTHGRTPISKDTKSLVAFQRHSGYDSYGKEQGYNAPVCKSTEFAYTTALNTLLRSSSRMLVGDAVTVFWSGRKDDAGFEDIFGDLWTDDPDRNVEAVRSLFKSPQAGAFLTDQDATRFYVLGLAPNAARIAVRFWIADTVAGMARRIRLHFQDTEIAHGPRDPDTLSLSRLLVSTAVQGKAANIPSHLGGDTMRAILQGRPYPQTLLQAAIRRVRAEREVTYPRAALIKACVNRKTRRDKTNNEEEFTVSLDENNTNIGYRLGRLFAALEKIQQDANPGINATIRDRFYGAASSTPVTVFGNLLRLKNHHLAKLESVGRRVFFEKLLCRIMDGITDFPPHLALADQGRFAIGYYHQTQKFYEKKAVTTTQEEQQ